MHGTLVELRVVPLFEWEVRSANFLAGTAVDAVMNFAGWCMKSE